MIRIASIRHASEVPLDRSNGVSGHERAVRPIIEAVREEGDRALLRFAQEFDGLREQPLRIAPEELESAASGMSDDMRAAVDVAVRNIREYAEAQLPRDYLREFTAGRHLGWVVRPLDAVG